MDSSSLSLAAKDKASVDSSSSLSLAGIHEVPDGKTLKLDALREKHSRSLSQKERLEKIAQVRKGNPGASEEEIKTLYLAHLIDEALKAQDLEAERRAAKRRQAREDEAQQEPFYALALDSMEKAIQENVDAVLEEKADWVWAKEALLVTHCQTMTMDERTAWRREIRMETRKANPLLTDEELNPHYQRAMIRLALEWRKNDLQRIKDSLLSSSLAAKKKEDDLLVRGPSQNALLEEFSSSLTAKQTEDILAEVRRSNPDATPKDFGVAYRAFKLQAALVWYRNLFLYLGQVCHDAL